MFHWLVCSVWLRHFLVISTWYQEDKVKQLAHFPQRDDLETKNYTYYCTKHNLSTKIGSNNYQWIKNYRTTTLELSMGKLLWSKYIRINRNFMKETHVNQQNHCLRTIYGQTFVKQIHMNQQNHCLSTIYGHRFLKQMFVNQQNHYLSMGKPLWSSCFICFVSLHPINNLSVMQGRVFLGWTSLKLGLMFLLNDTTQWHWWGSNLRPLGLESSTLPLSHCAPCLWSKYMWILVSQKLHSHQINALDFADYLEKLV